jgi:hypothetical protein
MIDLQDDARQIFERFASSCEGRENGEVLDAFIAITARFLVESAKIIHADGSSSGKCPLCLASECAKRAAHAFSKAEGYVPGQRSTEGQTRVSNADDIPVAAAPSRSPWRP